jgi:hypothetical protein
MNWSSWNTTAMVILFHHLPLVVPPGAARCQQHATEQDNDNGKTKFLVPLSIPPLI